MHSFSIVIIFFTNKYQLRKCIFLNAPLILQGLIAMFESSLILSHFKGLT